jgi:DNA polymerase III subunit epsilon
MSISLKLKKSLVFFDIEATGLNVLRDRIVQIALVRYDRDQPEPETFTSLVNPGIPISEEAIAVHGITPEKVKNAPTFPQIADKILAFIGDSDLAGYNSNRFDIPMLMEEFGRAGIAFQVDQRSLLDVQQIFYKMEPRTLKAAHRFYCGEEMADAHDALADVKATISVLEGQLRKYKDADYEDADGKVVPAPIVPDVQSLYRFTNDQPVIDVTQKLKLNAEGKIVFNFGKYDGQEVAQVFATDKNYYHWILEKEFSQQVKQLVKKIMKENEKNLADS